MVIGVMFIAIPARFDDAAGRPPTPAIWTSVELKPGIGGGRATEVDGRPRVGAASEATVSVVDDSPEPHLKDVPHTAA